MQTERAFRSRYTMAEPWADGQGILVNSFSGAVDIVSAEVAALVHRSAEMPGEIDEDLASTLLERGYYVDSVEMEEHAARYVGQRAKRMAREGGRPKYMFAVTLRCNLSCDYCWQVIEHGESRQQSQVMSGEMVDAAFAFIDRDLRERNKDSATISLFGGEPLIDAPDYHRLVREIGARCKTRGFQLHFTTNGRELAAFREEIREYKPSIQVTIDGCTEGEGTLEFSRAGQQLRGLFEEVTELARSGDATVYVRFLATRTTVRQFVLLADRIFAEEALGDRLVLAVAPIQNKTEFIDPRNPPKYRVLEVLMAALEGKAYSRRIAYVDWRSLLLFSNMRRGEEFLPEPIFFHCEANVDLTCFDGEGRLYACYEAIGDPAMAVGRYWPSVEIDGAHLAKYRERSAFSMPECTECPVSPICGGGCEVRGYKKNGEYLKPYCDSLRAEARMVLKNWAPVHKLLVGQTNDNG